MKQVFARVMSNVHILPEFKRSDGRVSMESRLIWLNCADIASNVKPGQFIMVRCGDACTLPRPFSVFRAYGADLALFYAVWQGGRGTEWLAQRRAGDIIQIMGPLGNGFTVNDNTRNILIVAGGIGIAPLYFLGQNAVARLCNITCLYGTSNKSRYPIPPEFKPVPATEDGSVGYKGRVIDLIPQYIEKADQVFVCGPVAMYKGMFQRRDELRLQSKQVQVSLEVRMGCGAGVCYSCTIRTKYGLRQVCKDGPVFNFEDIDWESI